MAKLGTYYGLCPLIDHRSLLGISEDVDAGVVIVTLGKNIAIKYKLSDQRQLHSWRTKDKFTSPIIYDKDEDKYYAVFNQTYIRMWSGNEENIDTLKKHKFPVLIHTIFTYKHKSFIVFQNGTVSTLSDALKMRKSLESKGVISDENDFITDMLCASLKSDTYIGLLLNSNGDFYFVWFIINNSENNQCAKIKLSRNEEILTGYVLHSDENQNNVKLITIWSDGKVYVYPITSEINAVHKEPPGELYTLLESVSCKQLLTVASLNDDYVAIYGAAPNEEGATLIIYNLQFRVVQSQLAFKLFSMGTKMWLVDNNLLFGIGQNLAVVPFTLETEQLAALVGSHKVSADEIDSDIKIVHKLEMASWGYEHENKSVIPKDIRKAVMEYIEQGWPENIVCETLLLDYISNEKVNLISNCLDYFYDVPEKCLAKTLNFCLTVDSHVFSDQQESISGVQPQGRCSLLNTILSKTFSDVLLIPQLRCELDVNSVITIMQHIIFLLKSDCLLPSLNVVETEKKLIEWSCVLLDGNYQKFLLTKDATISSALVDLKSLIQEFLNSLDSFKKLYYLLHNFKRRRSVCKSNTNKKYSIEQINLY